MFGKHLEQGARRIVGLDGYGLLQKHGTCVQARFHAHDGYPGHSVAFHQRALDGGRPPVAGQQRGMDVVGSATWYI